MTKDSYGPHELKASCCLSFGHWAVQFPLARPADAANFEPLTTNSALCFVLTLVMSQYLLIKLTVVVTKL